MSRLDYVTKIHSEKNAKKDGQSFSRIDFPSLTSDEQFIVDTTFEVYLLKDWKIKAERTEKKMFSVFFELSWIVGLKLEENYVKKM